MGWYERMNQALDYIEEHLLVSINMNEVAKIACCSVGTFQRTFSLITDISVSEYIRRRKMTLAALELQNSSIKIIDLALKYGYESPEAFTRVFHHIHGIPPTFARRNSVQLTAFPRLSFLLAVKGAVPMHYRIEDHEEMTMVGIKRIFSTDEQAHFTEIPKMWLDILNGDDYQTMKERTKHLSPLFPSLSVTNAVCGYESEQDCKDIFYLIGTFKTGDINSEGYTEVKIPASKWAIFKTDTHTIAETTTAIQTLIRHIYTEWLPGTNYSKLDGYDLELYYGEGSTCWSEVWIRITAP